MSDAIAKGIVDNRPELRGKRQININDLYPELLSEIFVYLDTESYMRARQTCRHWRNICMQKYVESMHIAKIWGLLGMGHYSTVRRIASGEIAMSNNDRERISSLIVAGGDKYNRQRFLYSQQPSALRFTGSGFQDIMAMFFNERHIRARITVTGWEMEFGRRLLISPDGTKEVFANKNRLFLGDLLVFDVESKRLEGWIEIERSFKRKLLDAPSINVDTLDETMVAWSADNRYVALLDDNRTKMKVLELKEWADELDKGMKSKSKPSKYANKSRKCRNLVYKKITTFRFEYPCLNIEISSGGQVAVATFRTWDSIVDIETGDMINIHSYLSHRPHTWRPTTIFEDQGLMTIPFGSNRTIMLGRYEQWWVANTRVAADAAGSDGSATTGSSPPRIPTAVIPRGANNAEISASTRGSSVSLAHSRKKKHSALWEYFRFLLSNNMYVCVRLCNVQPIASESCFFGFVPYHRQHFLTPVIVHVEEYTKYIPSFEWFLANRPSFQMPAHRGNLHHHHHHQDRPVDDMTEFSFAKDLNPYIPKLDIIQLMPILFGNHMKSALSADKKRLAFRVTAKRIYVYNIDEQTLVRVFNGPRPLALPFKTLTNGNHELTGSGFDGDFYIVGNDHLHAGLGPFGYGMLFEFGEQLEYFDESEESNEIGEKYHHHHYTTKHYGECHCENGNFSADNGDAGKSRHNPHNDLRPASSRFAFMSHLRRSSK